MVVYGAAVFLLVAVIFAASHLLGERHREPATDDPFESGIVSTGSARMRFDAKFYVMAMFFVIFDLETAFVFTWAVAARELGWRGYAEIVMFIAILGAALFYLWRIGALDWGTPRQRASRREPLPGEASEPAGAKRCDSRNKG
jgi:NADH-quinone oxidoreductase subunit A